MNNIGNKFPNQFIFTYVYYVRQTKYHTIQKTTFTAVVPLSLLVFRVESVEVNFKEFDSH